MRNRYQNNEEHRIAQLNRQRVYQAVKNNKISSTLSLLGAPISVVNIWLDFTGRYTTRSGLTHIDHFIPCVQFDLSDPEQQRESFSWINLRIIPASENISKNAKLPTKNEYMNHINMYLLFVCSLERSGGSKQREHEQAFKLLHNTACRFFDICYEDRCNLISS